MIKKIFSFFLLLNLSSLAFAVGDADFHPKIDAEKNAIYHNNTALIYLQENYYYGAIKELQLAISLNPHAQSTAVYYNNLAEIYMKIGYPNLAQSCYEQAIAINPMNFGYYESIVETFRQQKILSKKLAQYKAKKGNPLNAVMIGLILIAQGDEVQGIIKLDEFCIKEPNLIITNAVKNYVRKRTKDSFLI